MAWGQRLQPSNIKSLCFQVDRKTPRNPSKSDKGPWVFGCLRRKKENAKSQNHTGTDAINQVAYYIGSDEPEMTGCGLLVQYGTGLPLSLPILAAPLSMDQRRASRMPAANIVDKIHLSYLMLVLVREQRWRSDRPITGMLDPRKL